MSDGLRRMRPALGTLVELRIEGLDAARAARACEQAFAEIATIHRLMSFHESGSDLGRLHRASAGTPVRVDARTYDVLDQALCIAAATQGRFDPTVAAQQVARGLLPRPLSPWSPDPAARWHDIELAGRCRVRFARPLWIDLGGIAKGYAVDRAVEILVAAGATQVCVNAGGDIRVAGPRSETINLRTHAGIVALPALEIADAAVATSAGPFHSADGRAAAIHVNGCTRRPVGARRVVSVVASRCVVADSLTKVIMAGDSHVALQALEQFDAQARVHVSGQGWSPAGAAA
jgi:thiamine biosynthesis lipoprotein